MTHEQKRVEGERKMKDRDYEDDYRRDEWLWAEEKEEPSDYDDYRADWRQKDFL